MVSLPLRGGFMARATIQKRSTKKRPAERRASVQGVSLIAIQTDAIQHVGWSSHREAKLFHIHLGQFRHDCR